MTREEFNAQYELLKEVGTPGGSFHALSGSGAVVMVHFLGPADSAAAQDILGKIGRLEPAEGRRIVELTDVDGTSVVVTKFITDFQSFEAWLEMRVGTGTSHPQPPSPPSLPPAPPQPADVDPSEAPTKVLPRRGLGPSVEEAPLDEPTPHRGAGGPGEFTRMFQASGGGEPAPMEPTPPEATPHSPGDIGKEVPDPPGEPPRVDPAAPGEFTRMFQAGGPPETSPPSRPESGPGPEAPPPTLPPRPPPKTADPAAPRIPDEFPGSKPAWWGPLDQEAPKQPEEPGAFTRMFRTSGMPGEITPRPDPTPPHPPGGVPLGEPPPNPLSLGNEPYLDRLRPAPESALPSSPPPVRSTRPPVPSGPGEFTRVIQGTPGKMSSPAPPVPAPPPPMPPPPAKPPKTGMLVLGAVGILTLALIIVLLFALLGRAGPESSGEPAPNQESPEGP